MQIIVVVKIHQSVICLAEFFRQQEENVDTAILEGLKTKHTLNVIHVAFFCLISGNRSRMFCKFPYQSFKTKISFGGYSFISILFFTLGYLFSIWVIWVWKALMKIYNFKNLTNIFVTACKRFETSSWCILTLNIYLHI